MWRWVIASDCAYDRPAVARLGLLPDAAGTWTMPRAMGLAKAMGAALFAEKSTAEEAARMGLIWEAVPDGEFEAVWRARAGQLAAGPTRAFAGIKRALRASMTNGFDEQIALEAKIQGECGRSRDFNEGVAAFLEKRPPVFEGH